ncbi:hypothetical protein DPQ25_03580 [Hydrogeniiclostridium mannosilyticum]|uniref:HTH cro/C1-type domain-containing protein n=2 Tax=Hydrogeniiclostridium mannosilyticum TaxID=2764322 RepID=A0A328UNU5_9FIRM|nr:hypothetical protein DPQ25_03580 [Hydrogeniiclostridium mannosilyticum]
MGIKSGADMNDYGRQIELLLVKRNISKAAFADKIGITVQQLHAILRGKSMSTVTTLETMAEILKVPTDVLLQDIDKRFLLYAIDDYLNLIDRSRAQKSLEYFLSILEEEKKDE